MSLDFLSPVFFFFYERSSDWFFLATISLQSLLEPFSKLLSFVIQNAVFTLAYLVEVCGLCYRAFTKVRLHVCVCPGKLKTGRNIFFLISIKFLLGELPQHSLKWIILLRSNKNHQKETLYTQIHNLYVKCADLENWGSYGLQEKRYFEWNEVMV